MQGSWVRIGRVAFLLAAAAFPANSAVGSEVLAAADFEEDSVGDTARPGTPSVEEDVYNDSTTSGGVSAVETCSSGLRYRLSDTGTFLAVRGIQMPFPELVTSGTVTVTADLSAADTANGGTLSVDRPEEQGWYMSIGFGLDGNFRVHNQATSHAYNPGDTYRVTATLTLGSNETVVDYEVVNLDDEGDSFTVEDKTVSGAPELGRLRYRTAFLANGSFSIDNILVTRD